MKYWTELSNLEDAIFQIKKLNSQLSVMMDSELIRSNDERIPEAYKDFLYDFSDRFESAMAELNSDFQTVWDVIRNDSFDSERKESVDNTRWSRIVNDLQRWNEDSMASQPNTDDTITLTSSSDTIAINSMADTGFDLAWDEAYKNQSSR